MGQACVLSLLWRTIREKRGEGMSDMKLSWTETLVTLGYIDEVALTSLVEGDYISVEKMLYWANHLKEEFGGFEGVVCWCELYMKNKEHARLYLKDAMTTNINDLTYIEWWFDDEYTYEDWLGEMPEAKA